MDNLGQKGFTIKQWAEEDRPREKLLLKGKGALSDAELIAILIGSGTREMSAVEIAKIVLKQAKNNLNELAKWSVKDLQKIKGLGEARAVSIVSALELGRRRKEIEWLKMPVLTSSKAAYDWILPEISDLPHEEFWVILMKRNHEVIVKQQVSKGGVAGTVVDPKILFKLALDNLASCFIVVHNHPSGNLKPSEADIRLTKKLKQSGEILEIQLLDHLILAQSSYFSFADEGLL